MLPGGNEEPGALDLVNMRLECYFKYQRIITKFLGLLLGSWPGRSALLPSCNSRINQSNVQNVLNKLIEVG